MTMRIRRVRLRNLKRHVDLDLPLSPGVTIVRGPNEAGKSTIQQAIELALFRRVTSSTQEMAGLRRWGSTGLDPTVELEFDDEAGLGRLRKVFAGAKGTVELTIDGATTTDPAGADLKLAELTGVASEKFFRSTASIRQQELDELDKDEGALRDRLQQSMSGADKGTWAARRKLEDALRKYRSEGARNPGALKSTRDRIAQLERSAAEGEAALGRLEHDRQALSVARASRAGLDTELAEQRRQLAVAERAVQLEAKIQEAGARYTRHKRAAEIREAIVAKEGEHPSQTALAPLRSAVEAIRILEREISALRADLAIAPNVSNYDVALAPIRTARLVAVGAALVVGGLVVAVGGFLANLAVVGAALGILLIAAGATSAWLARRRVAVVSDLRTEKTLPDEELARRLRGRSDRAHDLQETELRRDQMLESMAVPDLATAETMLAAESAHVADIDQLEAEYRGLVGDEPPTEDIAKLRDRLAAEADEMRHTLAGMGEIGEEPQRHQRRCAATVAKLQADRERAVDDESRAGARVEQNAVDAEEVAATVESLDTTRADLAILERRVRIYQQTLDALDAAEQTTMKKAARYLEEQMGEDVARITGGRYRRIQVDENELTFHVWAPELDGWVDVRSLSQGTLDQFYLAARLALVRQVTQAKNPPLVFDDPFITFDDTRAREALALLKGMATAHQVIYFTCSSRYDQVADLVVELPGPGSGSPMAATERLEPEEPAEPPSPAVRREPSPPPVPAGVFGSAPRGTMTAHALEGAHRVMLSRPGGLAGSPSPGSATRQPTPVRRAPAVPAPGQMSLLAPEVPLEPATSPEPRNATPAAPPERRAAESGTPSERATVEPS